MAPRIGSDLFQAILRSLDAQSRGLIDHLICTERRRSHEARTKTADPGKRPDRKVLPWRCPEPTYGIPPTTLEEIRAKRTSFDVERRAAAELLSELLRLAPSEWRQAVETEDRFHTLALCELVLEASRQESFQDPLQGRQLAELGLHIARSLDSSLYSSHIVRDLCGRAWSELGNAFRLGSDLASAERCLLKARGCLHDTYDRLEKARFLSLMAALKKDQRQFQECLKLRDQAIAIYRRYQELHLLGRTLSSKGSDLLEMGNPEPALDCLEEAVHLIDPLAEPRIFLAAHHNRILALVDLGRVLEASEAFLEYKNLYSDDLWSQARRSWLQGRIAAGLGRLEQAAIALSTARKAFQKHDIPYDFALVSIELALVYARQGQTAEVKQLAAEMVPIFKSRQIHREALAALTLFRQAVEQETLTVGTLRKIIDRLEKAPKKA